MPFGIEVNTDDAKRAADAQLKDTREAMAKERAEQDRIIAERNAKKW